jgi:peroxiredoxin Q/BCP
MLEPGQTPADFTLLDQAGAPVAWSSLRGKPVVVFFYPKASTPGCTQEACDFRDLRAAFDGIGVTVIGASADAPKAQARFADKHTLPFPLLSDPDHVVLVPWGVWGKKKLYGKDYDGIVRTTVLFDAQGKVAKVWSPVKVAGHVDAVLAAARALVGG